MGAAKNCMRIIKKIGIDHKMGHYTENKFRVIINYLNDSLYFYVLKIPPQGGRRYDQAQKIGSHG